MFCGLLAITFLIHVCKASARPFRSAEALIGVFPIVSTASDVMQQASAAVGIIPCPLANPVANKASSESPAPATSSGLTERAEGPASELA